MAVYVGVAALGLSVLSLGILLIRSAISYISKFSNLRPARGIHSDVNDINISND